MGLSTWLEERKARTAQRQAEHRRRALEGELARRVQAAKPRPAPAKTVWLSAAGRMAVVGESHYQAALHLASGGAVVERFDQGAVVTCALVPELSNPYDNNAVRIDCLTPHGAVTVGYIDRHNAPTYQYQLLGKVPRDAVGICRGTIMGGGPKHYGIWLSLADPTSMIMSSQPEVGHQLLAPDVTVAVTGEQNYATALASVHGGVPGPARYYATLRPAQITKGVHSGEPTIEVLIGGDVVGQLTATMGQRYLPLLDPRIPMCCEACVLPGEKRYEVTLHLPKMN